MAARRVGNVEEALDVYESVIPEMEQAFGGEHAFTLATVGQFGDLQRARGLQAASEATYTKYLKGCRKCFGPDHRHTLSAQLGLVVILEDVGRFENALELRRDIVPRLARTWGPSHRRTIGGHFGLVELLHVLDKDDAVLAESTSLLHLLAGTKEMPDWMRPMTLRYVADARQDRGETLMARAHVNEFVAALASISDTPQHRVGYATSIAGKIEFAAGDSPESKAPPLTRIRQGLDKMKEQAKEDAIWRELSRKMQSHLASLE